MGDSLNEQSEWCVTVRVAISERNWWCFRRDGVRGHVRIPGARHVGGGFANTAGRIGSVFITVSAVYTWRYTQLHMGVISTFLTKQFSHHPFRTMSLVRIVWKHHSSSPLIVFRSVDMWLDPRVFYFSYTTAVCYPFILHVEYQR